MDQGSGAFPRPCVLFGPKTATLINLMVKIRGETSEPLQTPILHVQGTNQFMVEGSKLETWSQTKVVPSTSNKHRVSVFPVHNLG